MGGPKDNEDEGEIALITFSGICCNCNQSGHRAFECPRKKKQEGNNSGGNGSNSENNNNHNTIVCSICNKIGHGNSNCWLKPGNENKKPQWLKNKEQASPAILGRSIAPELLLCRMTFPNFQKMLEDPNVWIGDTAATTKSTPCTLGLYKMQKSTVKGLRYAKSIFLQRLSRARFLATQSSPKGTGHLIFWML
jgi:hypothetical protein